MNELNLKKKTLKLKFLELIGILFIVISCNNDLLKNQMQNNQMQNESNNNLSKSDYPNKKENKKYKFIEQSKKFNFKKAFQKNNKLKKLIKTNWKEKLNKLKVQNFDNFDDFDDFDDNNDFNTYMALIESLNDNELVMYTQYILYNIKYLNNLPYELFEVIMHEFRGRLSKNEKISEDNEKSNEIENKDKFTNDDLRKNHNLILKFINKEYDYILDPSKINIRTLFNLDNKSAYDEFNKQKEKDSKKYTEAFYIIKKSRHYSVLYYNFKDKIIYHLDSTGDHSRNFVYNTLSEKPEIIGGFSYLCPKNINIKQQDKGNGCYLYAYLNALLLAKLIQKDKLSLYLNKIINNEKEKLSKTKKKEPIIITNIEDLPMGTEILIRNTEMGKLLQNNFENILNKIPGGLIWSYKKQKKFHGIIKIFELTLYYKIFINQKNIDKTNQYIVPLSPAI